MVASTTGQDYNFPLYLLPENKKKNRLSLHDAMYNRCAYGM